ncbi:MAG: hypothetical protein JWO94_1128 [Verrucomicrobiaceae bacterium]|nr:hypothetical protein [Verrucomicrobiaceae bacterium]
MDGKSSFTVSTQAKGELSKLGEVEKLVIVGKIRQFYR